ncbi:hexokinase, putative [Babesia bigemina]|uniref:Phosphotransferase n=1 Tax=Babesia bigemina TaxID=5866 RepID=A0A061DB36_BABBI|nr:hexokinase, putative [Babesia bigemina]CDR96129.1 hexokinase, putative [Babesia bigemina]|eukprot:XP_012768315.1 hexokinase, putative [Babesia bigemina]
MIPEISVIRQVAENIEVPYKVTHLLDADAEVRLDQIVGQLSLPIEYLKDVAQSFYGELVNGLKAHRRHRNLWLPNECSFKMLDSHITTVPTGDETGCYYAIDFGGSNLRSVRINVKGKGTMERMQSTFSLRHATALRPKGLLDRTATATELFDHFAKSIGNLMEESGDAKDSDKIYPVGFTFSFPCTMLTKRNAILLDWTKGFETGRDTNEQVEGRDIGMLMDEAFKRNKVNGRVSIILNDTVGTLMSVAYQKPQGYPECRIGLILGTGFNVCYVEHEYLRYGYVGKVINIECGNFDKELPITPVDYEIDWYTSNSGRGKMEKLIAGAYLGEIIRRNMIIYLSERATAQMWKVGTFTAVDAADILNDKSDDHAKAREIAKRCWGADFDEKSLKGLRRICEAVFDRSAGLAAAAIVATARRTLAHATSKITCAVDGSLYVKNEWYRERMLYYMEKVSRADLVGSVIMYACDDGSGKGAAIAAAMIKDDE